MSKKNKKKQNNTGFTLLEIVVVVVIIAILITVFFITIDTARKRTRDAVIISSLEQIQAIAETVYNPANSFKSLNGHKDIVLIKEKINEIGRDFNLHFPIMAANPDVKKYGYDRYCAYVYLFQNKSEIFCVDSTGFRGRVSLSGNKSVGCFQVEYLPYSCEYID